MMNTPQHSQLIYSGQGREITGLGGPRALVNRRRTSTGEESLERLYEMLENLLQGGVQSEAFRSLRQKVREL
jgi:hypothetical protein